MKFFIKSSILFVVLFLSVQFIYAQDSLGSVKFRRNALKVGTSLTVSKYFISYEHAFTKYISVGGMASYALGNFPGYSGIIFARYYFRKFNRSSIFLEARGSYAHYNPTAYSGYTRKQSWFAGDYDVMYHGKHKADIDYWSVGVSGGYKYFCLKRFFFEIIIGLHFGKATFGSDDIYLKRSGIETFFGTNSLQDVFKNSGPGMPFHYVLNFGYAF